MRSLRGPLLCLSFGIVLFLTNMLILYKTDLLTPSIKFQRNQSHSQMPSKVVNPPEITIDQDHLINKYSQQEKYLLGERLSLVVQRQIKAIQDRKDCSKPNLLCGHIDDCGFGCEVHHRAGCLMLSYALNLPLIVDEVGWPFSKKWNEVFEPIGSNCLPGNNTFHWSWKKWSKALHRGSGTPYFNSTDLDTWNQIKYPLRTGLPVSKKLGDLVEKITPKPFLWWVGQFMKYILRPRKAVQEKIELYKKAIGFAHPIIGLQVRRTDKVKEGHFSHHEIDEYMKMAEYWWEKVPKGQFVEVANQTLTKRLLVASDESTVLPEAQKKYPEWNITGFPSNATLWNVTQRIDALDDIVRDVLILSECDYVICGQSSNVCRLIYEILCWKHLDCQNRLGNIDVNKVYMYVLQDLHSINPGRITKVEP